MNAPDRHALPILAEVAHIYASPTNPRRHFDATAHAEMTDSVRQHGVLQPVLLRPWPKNGTAPHGMSFGETLDAIEAGRCYELISGERRWRAARSADVPTILAVVRDLDDIEVLKIQIIENLQRQDVHPLEEAMGFDRLMKAGELSAEDVGEQIGKSKAYVYARLKLLALCDNARTAFFDGKLNASTALLIARIPHPDLQMKALVEITKPDWQGDTPSFRAAKEAIQRGYQLRLADATWPLNDARLLPAAGSCSKCPKRSGNQTVLFEDESADLCLDPKCYADKRDAIYQRRKALADNLGQKVIEGDEAKAVMPYGYSSGAVETRLGAIDPDARCRADPENRTFREILGTNLPPVTLVIEDQRTRTLHEAIDANAMAEALKAAGIAVKGADDEDEEEARIEAERQARANRIGIEEQFRARIRDRVRLLYGHRFDADPRMPHWLTAMVACELLEYRDEEDLEEMMRRYDYRRDEDIETNEQLDAFCDHIVNLPTARVCGLVIDLLLMQDPEINTWTEPDHPSLAPRRLLSLAKRGGIDVEALRAEVIAERQNPEKRDDAEESAPAETTSTPVGAARADEDGATPAAPAGGDGAPKPGKKAKAKTNPAPASPSNEPATPADADATAEAPKAAPKKRKSKGNPAPAEPANETPGADASPAESTRAADRAQVGDKVAVRADAAWPDGGLKAIAGKRGEIIVAGEDSYTVEARDDDGFRCRDELTRDQFTVIVAGWPFPVSES